MILRAIAEILGRGTIKILSPIQFAGEMINCELYGKFNVGDIYLVAENQQNMFGTRSFTVLQRTTSKIKADRIYFPDKALDDLVMLVDTKEKERFIEQQWKATGIKSKRVNLSTGNFSFSYCGVNYDDKFVIERKKNTNKLINSLISQRKRFIREFEQEPDRKWFLLIEDLEFFKKILCKDYLSQVDNNAVASNLFSLMTDFPVSFLICPADFTPIAIYKLCLKYLQHDVICKNASAD